MANRGSPVAVEVAVWKAIKDRSIRMSALRGKGDGQKEDIVLKQVLARICRQGETVSKKPNFADVLLDDP